MEENIESEISEDDINLDELLAEFGLSEEEEVKENADEDADDKYKMEEELAQALATIDELRSTLQEVNLLNAKLLYMNKVFKGHNLTESQKVQVVKTFDKAESAKEAKLVFESLSSSLVKKETEKNPIKESLGFASKASGIIAGSTNRSNVIDSDAQVDRWAKLAGLK
jgi:crotonobetainyl-CoA:carnitine CoA-transferase CaiB-like acyl-CoA transferase